MVYELFNMIVDGRAVKRRFTTKMDVYWMHSKMCSIDNAQHGAEWYYYLFVTKRGPKKISIFTTDHKWNQNGGSVVCLFVHSC